MRLRRAHGAGRHTTILAAYRDVTRWEANPLPEYQVEKPEIRERCGAVVYFCHVPPIRRIKIGTTKVVPLLRVARMMRYESGLPHDIEWEIVGTIDGGRSVERCIHHKFRDHRVHGEWFEDTIMDEVLELVRLDAEWFEEAA